MAGLSIRQKLTATLVIQGLILWVSTPWILSVAEQRADALSSSGQFQKALRLQLVITRVDPSRLEALIGLGTTYEDLNRDTHAERTYWTIIDRFPNRNEGYFLLSKLARRHGDTINADHWLNEAANRPGQFSDEIQPATN